MKKIKAVLVAFMIAAAVALGGANTALASNWTDEQCGAAGLGATVETNAKQNWNTFDTVTGEQFLAGEKVFDGKYPGNPLPETAVTIALGVNNDGAVIGLFDVNGCLVAITAANNPEATSIWFPGVSLEPAT